jgi:hypothetical protein
MTSTEIARLGVCASTCVWGLLLLVLLVGGL